MLKFIKSLFFKSKAEEKGPEKNLRERENITSSDFIDYDGMGNQGRFPSRKTEQ